MCSAPGLGYVVWKGWGGASLCSALWVWAAEARASLDPITNSLNSTLPRLHLLLPNHTSVWWCCLLTMTRSADASRKHPQYVYPTERPNSRTQAETRQRWSCAQKGWQCSCRYAPALLNIKIHHSKPAKELSAALWGKGGMIKHIVTLISSKKMLKWNQINVPVVFLFTPWTVSCLLWGLKCQISLTWAGKLKSTIYSSEVNICEVELPFISVCCILMGVHS